METFIEVSGADGAGLRMNGIYARFGSSGGRPKYHQLGGACLLFFEGTWKITAVGASYASASATGQLPPMGTWQFADGSILASLFHSPPHLAWKDDCSTEAVQGSIQVPAHVLHHWEDMLDDEETKDVTFEAQDGEVLAHSVLLRQISEPFKAMLSSGMRESRTKIISMKEFTCAQLKFFLRHVYTGHKDSVDWHGKDDDPVPPIELLLASLQLAKSYVMPSILSWITDKLKQRLEIDTFNEITSCAIRKDIGPLRLHCLLFAKEHEAAIRRVMDQGSLSPEVVYELGAIWNCPDGSGPQSKKRRTRTAL